MKTYEERLQERQRIENAIADMKNHVTPEMALETMRHLFSMSQDDEETAHEQADKLMLRILRQHGYEDAADIFENMDKYYS